MTIFDYNYLFFEYADDKALFKKDVISIKHLVCTFGFFRTFPD